MILKRTDRFSLDIFLSFIKLNLMDDIHKNLSLQCSKSELNHLIGCAERVLSAGHWGSSDILIPEEQNLLAMLKKSRGTLNLSPFYFKMLIDWIGSATGEGTVLLPEDQSIIEQCRSVFEGYHEAVERDYRLRQGEIRSLKESFAVMGIKVAIQEKKEKGSKGAREAFVAEERPYRRGDYKNEAFGPETATEKNESPPGLKHKNNSLAQALDAGTQQSFFSKKGKDSKDIEVSGVPPVEPEASESEKSKPVSRLKRIRNYLAQALDGGRDRSFSPGKGSYHKERDAMKDHVEKAEKIQKYMKKKSSKL